MNTIRKHTTWITVLSLCLSWQVHGQNISVPGDHATIQDAIDAAVDGDTILVGPGVYDGGISTKGKWLKIKSTHGPESTIISESDTGIFAAPNEAVTDELLISGFTFKANQYGIRFDSETSPNASIENCHFVKNTKIGVWGQQKTLRLSNCRFVENSGERALFKAKSVSNSLFLRNTGGEAASVHKVDDISHCIFVGNRGSRGDVANYHGSFVNCIFWDLRESLGYGADRGGTDLSVKYSIVQHGWPGEGNINEDPLFLDMVNDDYRLSVSSPAIDAGDPNSANDPDGSRADIGIIDNVGGASSDPFGTVKVYSNNSFTVLASVKIDDVSASIGDVVAGYVGGELRGKQVIENIVGGVAYLTLLINVDSPEEKITKFELWDANQKDDKLKILTMKKVIDLVAGGQSGTASNLVSIKFKRPVVQSLTLKTGWNLVSFYVESDDMTSAAILNPIKDQLLQIKNLTQAYDPSLPVFLNTLTRLNVKDGYWVKMKEDVSFDVEGIVPDGAAILVKEGWNLVGYPKENGESPVNALSSINNKVIQIKNLTESYDPSLASFLNTLTTITPGLGYWLKVNGDSIWIVGEETGESSNQAISKMSPSTGARWSRVTVYPTIGANVLAEVYLNDELIGDGFNVMAHVGDELRGMGQVVISEGKSYVTLNVSLKEVEHVKFIVLDEKTGREYHVPERLLLKSGETYGKDRLVKLNGVLPASDKIIIIGYQTEPFGLKIQGVKDREYVVESTVDFEFWNKVETRNPDTDGLMIIELKSDQSQQKFFRIKTK